MAKQSNSKKVKAPKVRRAKAPTKVKKPKAMKPKVAKKKSVKASPGKRIVSFTAKATRKVKVPVSFASKKGKVAFHATQTITASHNVSFVAGG